MPLFEFVCSTCQRNFEELLRSASDTRTVVCPVCGSREVKKKLSTFASRLSGGKISPTSATSCSTGSV